MNQQQDLPRIRQIMFIIDKNRHYKFDVNQTITIKGCKKMIVAAANLGKSGLRVFHRGVEYTDQEESSIVELFPDLQLVEFTISIVYVSEEDKESNIKLKLGSYCTKHNFKYPYFYCYDCGRSICSVCLQSGEHNGHNWLEKYDYLQNSRNLVESIFNDMNEMLSSSKLGGNLGELLAGAQSSGGDMGNTGPKSGIGGDHSGSKSSTGQMKEEIISGARAGNKAEIEELKAKLRISFSTQLIDMIKKIEAKLIDVVEYFNDNSGVSYINIAKNILLLKDHCSEGLDKLKHEIAIEDMMLDEDIFLTFDRKFKEIATEKTRVLKDVKKFEEMKDNMKLVVGVCDTIYTEIYTYLDKYLNSTVYSEIKVKISEQVISIVSKEDIMQKLFSDIKKKGKGLLSTSKVTGETPKNAIFKSIYNYTSQFTEEGLKEVRSTTPERAPQSGALPQSGHQTAATSNQALNINVQSSSAIYNITKGIHIAKCIPETKEMIIYNDSSNTVTRKTVEFPTLLGINQFLPFCAWQNLNGKLYISGGQASNNMADASELFIQYDCSNDSLTRLPDMLIPRHSHSMGHSNENIYVVGGFSNNSTEKFDLKSLKWTKLSNLNSEERMNPILYVHSNYLYSFFGVNKNGFMDTVERLNTKNLKAKWEVVPYKNPNKLDLKMIGCAIIEASEKEIYLFGGKTKEGLKREAIKFDFSNNTFATTPIKLDEGTYFHESTLIELGKSAYGQFHMDNNEHFLKIQLN